MTLQEWLGRRRRKLGLWLLGADPGVSTEPGVPKPMQWTPDAVNNFWTAVSRTRLTELSFARTAARPLLLAVKHHLRPGIRCLDFGAGSGELVDVLLQAGFSTAAFEPSEGGRQAIRARFAGRYGFLGVVDEDGNEQYDAVFAAEVVEHILDSQFEATLAMMARKVVAGGLLVVTTPNDEDLDLGSCICPNCSTLFHRWQHVRRFTPASLEAALRPHGFEPIVTHLVEFNPAHFVALEALDAGAPLESLVDYLRALRRDEPVRMGAENSILCLARRAR